MRGYFKKTIAVIMVVVMTLTAAPLGGFVGLDLPSLFSFKSEAATYSGTCGDNLTWSLDTTTGVLNISGTGEMYDYIADYDEWIFNQPWYSYIRYIKKVVISDGVTSIGDNAFVLHDFNEVSLPDTLTTIGKRSFYNCNDLISVTIPNGVVSIGDRAFAACQFMTNVIIPASVESIGYLAFCSGDCLLSITVDTSNKYYSSDEYGALFNKTKTQLIQYPAGSLNKKHIISNSVCEIKDGAFSGCNSLEDITLPDSVKAIGAGAFYCCTNLKSINIPNGVTCIGDSTFECCESLEHIALPNSVKAIGVGAFVGCESLEHIALPDSVKAIGAGAFVGCESLEHIALPDSVKAIGDYAFGACYSLTSVTIPDSVTTIGDDMFYSCYSLTSVTIPDSVTTIGDYVFYSCYSLSDVYYTGTQEQWNAISIGSYNQPLTNATIHYNYPPASTNKYEIKMYANLPTMLLGEGKSIGAAIQLEKNGNVEKDFEFTVSVSDGSVVSISEFTKKEDYASFYINALKEGSTQIVITEAVSGSVMSFPIEVASGIITYNESALPSYKDGDYKYDGYICGMYIADYDSKDSETKAGYKDVSFTVYNASFINGSVEVYDKNGNLCDSEMIERFDNGMVTSFADVIGGAFEMAKEFILGEAFTYRDSSFSHPTKISVQVPLGGHIEISNNPLYSQTCAMYNFAEFVTMSVLMLSDVITIEADVKKLSGETSKSFVDSFVESLTEGDTAAEQKKKLAEDITELLVKNTGKEITSSSVGGTISLFMDEGLAILDEYDINLVKTILKIAASSAISLGEDALTNAMGTYGDVLKGMFKFSEYAEYTVFFVNMCKEYSNKAFSIYINDKDNCLVNDDVVIKSQNGNSILTQNNFVLRSFVLSDSEITSVIKNSLDSLSSQYTVRNIYLEKDGAIAQPGQIVRVYMPVPNGYDINKCSVYWVQDNGELANMGAWIEDGYLVFETTHFSYYAIVENARINLLIKTPSTTTVNYGETLVLQLEEIDLPVGYAVEWIVDGSGFSKVVSEDGTECRLTSTANGTATVTAKIVDENGEAVLDGEGNEISDSITLTSKAGFFQKLISFFKNLFRINRIIY
ncbi:MAG: leucine-rich repeat protein [Clostridia bacterium]|nr:leucine-rich repeat protein [Clostridia bacterium]